MRVLSRMWQMLLKGITEARDATRPAAAAEMVLVRIAYVADMPTPDEAIRMIEQNGGASPVVAASTAPRNVSAPTASAVPPMPVRPPTAPRGSAEASARPQMMAPAPEVQSVPIRRVSSFPELVALAAEKRDLLTKAALEADVRLVRIEDGRLEIALERNASRTLVNDLSRKLEQWTGRRWAVIVSNEAGQPTLREQNLVEKSQRERTAEADPRVREVLARFPGARVVEVRKLAAEPPESDATGQGLNDENFVDEDPLSDSDV
jgi:DNA polymerase-3 subunit gamma/tau